MAASKSSKGGSGKRELLNTGTDKRYVRRDAKGRFTTSDDVGRSLSQDVRQHAKTVVQPGFGDQGDQKPKTTAKKPTAKKPTAKKPTAKKPSAKKSSGK